MAKLNFIRTIDYKDCKNRLICVAVSGGIDSMVLLDFMIKSQGKENVLAVHFVHEHDDSAEESHSFVSRYCSDNRIALHVKKQTNVYDGGSIEKYWRDGRQEMYNEINADVATGHHLDDAVEWYLFTSFRGDAKVMPYRTGNRIKPFIHSKKEDFYEYAAKNSVPYIEDQTNFDSEFGARNAIRNKILPEVLKVNPGIYKVVKKKILENIIMEELGAQ